MAMARIEREPVIRVRLLAEPCLWLWEIVDSDRRVIESSWAGDWVAFATRAEAVAAGARRLAERTAAHGSSSRPLAAARPSSR
jgi:hypothetical protein